MPLPGCEMGDIGPKFGYNSKENGYLIFKNYRIPRKNIVTHSQIILNQLSRYVQVDREGNFAQIGDKRLLYSTIMQSRVLICNWIVSALLNSLTISIRYAAVRRQFSTITK